MSKFPYAAAAASIECPFRRARFVELTHQYKHKEPRDLLAMARRGPAHVL